MLKLQPHHLEAAYDFLRTLPPFSRWRLPPGEEIHFSVTRSQDTVCTYNKDHKGEAITVSCELVGHTDSLLRGIAHEVVHQKLRAMGNPNWRQHGAVFRRYWATVAKHHGFDPKSL